jgi:uncharacterized protein
MWKVTTRKKIKPSQVILIEGLPGIGNVGKIVVDYLIEQLKAEKIAHFFSYLLPNTVFVNQDNLVELPKIELYYKKINNQDFLFLTGDVQPSNEEASYKFTECVLDQAKKYTCKEIITLGGIGLTEIPQKPKVYCTGNDKSLISKFLKQGAKDNIYGLVGPIIGVSGLLIGLSTAKKIKAATLLVETYNHPMYLGITEAKETLKILNKQYELNLNFKNLNKEIRLLEKQNGEGPKDPKLKRLKKLKEINYIG